MRTKCFAFLLSAVILFQAEISVPVSAEDIGEGLFYTSDFLSDGQQELEGAPEEDRLDAGMSEEVPEVSLSGSSAGEWRTVPGVEGGQLRFDCETGTITDCETTVTAAHLPSEIEGSTVRRLGSAAFQDCTNLTELVIPDTVEQIEHHCFSRCSSLRSVRLPEGITIIESSTFEGCTGLQKVEIPDSVVGIGRMAFSYCESLAEIVLPREITRIPDYAFFGCGSLKTIQIPEGVTEIGEYAFSCHGSLQSVNIPSTLTRLGYSAFLENHMLVSLTISPNFTKEWAEQFRDCGSLKNINFSGTREQYVSLGMESYFPSGTELFTFHVTYNVPIEKPYSGKGWLPVPGIVGGEIKFQPESGMITACRGNITQADIPATIQGIPVRGIEAEVFLGQMELKTVKLPQGIESIGTSAFSGCRALSKMELPETLREIGENAFSGCGMLEELVIPEGVKVIKAYTFSECSSLEKIVLPSTVKEIEEGAFRKTNLPTIHLPEGMTSIAPYLFVFSSITTLELPKSIKRIESGAFSECSIENLILNEGLERIEEAAIPGSSELKSICIPESVTYVGKYNFLNCDNLRNLQITPNAKPEWFGENGITANCPSIENIYFTGTREQFTQAGLEDCFPTEEVEYGQRTYHIFYGEHRFPKNMYRLYNPYSGEHLYTASVEERSKLIRKGWKGEGTGWYAPAEDEGKVIWRLYNPQKGFEEHHFTADENEIRVLTKEKGWNLEGPAWRSAPDNGEPVYRLFNIRANNSASSHHYTTDLHERDVLISQGWRYEGIAWYGIYYY